MSAIINDWDAWSSQQKSERAHQISLTIWEQFSDEKPLLSIQQQERVSGEVYSDRGKRNSW